MLQHIEKRSLLHQKDYRYVAHNSKNLMIKSFFFNLTRQKEEFVSRLQDEIKQLLNDLPKPDSFRSEKFVAEDPAIYHVSRYEKMGLVKECYRRENRSLRFYDCALEQVDCKGAHDLLLAHKKKVQQCLREIKCMGIKIYEVEDDAVKVPFKIDEERSS